ncbi:hypothetical protein CPSG_00420 [Coccidioides posadasii str. Silveira]|uniref:Uncharacterized protein n=1 Tax=Coccidioides posadasii (strain RMSCC 757 / Silveira) TaxID=443226 RepID=E9CRZ8_COCPS|nr:hypothetical protein CPSG_00420 [Coccidioides posadasii str. Silveira]
MAGVTTVSLDVGSPDLYARLAALQGTAIASSEELPPRYSHESSSISAYTVTHATSSLGWRVARQVKLTGDRQGKR